MDRNRPKRAPHPLHPPTEPFDQRMIEAGDGHRIYVEQCGSSDGIPVVVLHGGPGGGCSPAMRRYFDPRVFRIVLFDQRGCGRSRPNASIEANTTWHLVSDIELIRQKLGIDRWIVFGGSWGATLGLVYAATHPNRVAYLALRGIFLMMRSELDWFYGGGAGHFWPELWKRFLDPLPPDERDDPITAYSRRLFSGDLSVETAFARAWAGWEYALASIGSEGRGGESPSDYTRAFARLENHYFVNRGWLDEDGWILKNAALIADIPGIIVQGRFDMICPPRSAVALSHACPRLSLRIIPDAGHALSEPGIGAELLRDMDRLASNPGPIGF